MRAFNAKLEKDQKDDRQAIIDARAKRREEAKAAEAEQRTAAFNAAVDAQSAEGSASCNSTIYQNHGKPCLKRHRNKKATCFRAFDLMLDEPACTLCDGDGATCGVVPKTSGGTA